MHAAHLLDSLIANTAYYRPSPPPPRPRERNPHAQAPPLAPFTPYLRAHKSTHNPRLFLQELESHLGLAA